MKTEDLKVGFWGYKKFSVYQYITSLEEEFSAKLLEKDKENQTALDQAQQKVQQLEQELETLRRRYDALEQQQMLISNTLLEAQRYAEALKKESEEQNAQAQQQLEAALEQREQILAQYDAQLGRLRDTFRTMLLDMDDAAQQQAQQLTEVKACAPDGNMSLFSRNPEPAVL